MILLALSVIVSTAQPQGGIDPNVTVSQLCTPGYTKTIRPPASWTNRIKKNSIKALGLTEGVGFYELDHECPLEGGGAPRDPNNLWLEPWTEARRKDVVETRLHRCLCAGEITLKQLQDVFFQKRWLQTYTRIEEGEKCPV